MADIKDIMGLPRVGTPADKPDAAAAKPKAQKMKRPEGMSREAFALLGDSHPIVASQLVGGLAALATKKKETKVKPKPGTKTTTVWLWKPFKSSARTDGLELMHWVKAHKDASGQVKQPEETDYSFAKYNKKVQLLKYNDEEYSSLISGDGTNWTREETDYLFDMCERLDLRFVAIADRYEFPGGPPRSMEDIKERYFGVARTLLLSREGGEAPVSHQVLVKHPYNKAQETERKQAIHILLTRDAKQVQEENAILAEARQIEERRRIESGVAAVGPGRGRGAAAAAAGARQGSPSQQAAAAGATPAAPGAPPGLPAPAAPAQPQLPSTDLRFPPDYTNDPGPGNCSLFDTQVQPLRPGRHGVYARGAHAIQQATAMGANMPGGQRAYKAVEQTLTDLGYVPALAGPRHASRAVCGTFLALRAEVIAMHDLKRSLQNRALGAGADYDGGATGGGTKKRTGSTRRR